jgi:DNA-binding LacI/PurR family transcriptional regulator
VSNATVSNALNGTGRVSEATRRRVLDAADQLGYRPMAAARALTGTRTGVLGLALAAYDGSGVPYVQIPYYAEAILAATDAAHSRGRLLLAIPGDSDAATWWSAGIDGVIHMEPRRADPVREILVARGLPLVSDGRPHDSGPDDLWVDNDHRAAMETVCSHLREAGAERIGLLLPRHDDYATAAAEDAYRADRTRLDRPVLIERYDHHDRQGERDAALRLIDGTGPRAAHTADAVIGLLSESGHSILAAAALAGRVVPDDLLVACFSEDPTYGFTDPPLTTLSLQPRLLSASAVDLLVDVLDDLDVVQRQVEVPTLLHPRRSTAPSP